MTERSPTLLFLHIPKTAGLTMRELLLRQFPAPQVLGTGRAVNRNKDAAKRYLQYLETGATQLQFRPRNDAYKEFLGGLPAERLERVRLVLGHFWFGLHDVLPGPCRYMTIVRNPVERVLSEYQHRVVHHGLGISVEDYLLSERDFHMDNDQVRRLSNTDEVDARAGECTQEMLDRAVRNLDEWFLVAGTTERFDELVVALGHLMGWRRFTYASRNRSKGRPRRGDLSDEAMRVLLRHNEADAELHRIVTTRFDEQVARIGIDVEREIARLRRRVRIAEVTRPTADRLRLLRARILRRPPSPNAQRRLGKREVPR